jgi:predicted porin
MGGVAAQAADLGGNCCADLEERVAELEATTARKGNRVVSLQVYGQINRAMVWHDDNTNEGGEADVNEFSFRDNGGRSGSRFGFRGSASVTSDVSIGYRMELGVDDDNGTSISTRHMAVYIQSVQLGRVTFGQTSTATDGLGAIALASVWTPFSPEESSAVSPIAAAAAPTDYDGPRATGVHYSSPTIAGFILSASYYHVGNSQDDGDNDADGWDVALRYAGEFGSIRVAAGVGYRVDGNGVQDTIRVAPFAVVPATGAIQGVVAAGVDGEDTKTFTVAGSIMHTPTGLFLNAGYGSIDSLDGAAGDDIDGWNIQAGISQNWFGFGATTLGGNYGENDGKGTLVDGTYYGFGVTQNINAAATDLYLVWQKYEIDAAPGVEDEANTITAGMRVQF